MYRSPSTSADRTAASGRFHKGQGCTVTTTIEGKPTVTLEFNDAKDYVDFMLGRSTRRASWQQARPAAKGDINMMALKWPRSFREIQGPHGGQRPEQELLVLRRTISVNQKFATGPVMGKFLNAPEGQKDTGQQVPQVRANTAAGHGKCAPSAGCASDEWVEVGPKGQVRYMEYVYYASPDPLTGETRETPYGMVNILLDGCKGNDTFAHLMRRDQIDKIQIGWNDKPGTTSAPCLERKPDGEHIRHKVFRDR